MTQTLRPAIRLLCAMVLTCSISAADRPNVLFIAVDDMNDWLSYFDSDLQAITPNIDRLAARGVAFTNAHTPGTYCAPARSAIFTGLHAPTTGFYRYQVYFALRPDLTPMQMAFQNGGYGTYGTGKLFHHTKGHNDLRGWTEFGVRSQRQREDGWALDSWSDETPKPDPFPYSSYSRTHGMKPGHFLEWGPLTNEQEKDMADTMRTDWAIAQLQKEHDEPFFIGLGLYSPHHPNYCPQKYFDMYDRDSIAVQWHDVADLDDVPDPMARKMRHRHNIYEPIMRDLDALPDLMQSYLASFSYADAMIGRVLDALEASPHADNTVVVLWSDHGYHFGEKGQWGKQTLWQRTTNVPFIWAGPGIAEGVVSNTTVSLIDMFPTFVEMCGLPATSQQLEGTSLVSTLADPTKATDRNVLVPYVDPKEYAIINEKWRYIHYKNGTEELYAVDTDPKEFTNLANNPEYDAIKAELRESAPKTFAPPGRNLSSDRDLVIEGETYRWEIPKN